MSTRMILARAISQIDEDAAFAPVDCLSDADAIIAALRAAGYSLVPTKPTEAMVGAAFDAALYKVKPNVIEWDWVRSALTAAISAAKEQP